MLFGELRQRLPRYENRALLDLAHLVHECTNCGTFVEHGCEPAHENGQAAGKAQSSKGEDNRHAALCHDCHLWYDSGRDLDPSGLYVGERAAKREMIGRAIARTFDLYWRNHWVGVTVLGLTARR
jgi:hypothetical protein